MKARFVSLSAACLALAFALTACGSGDRGALPANPGPASKTTAGPSATAPTKPTATDSGPDSVPADSTHTYGGLKVVVDLPADIPAPSRPGVRLFSEFAQTIGRTWAQGKLDPSMSNLASAEVVNDYRSDVGPDSYPEVGTVTFIVRKVDAGTDGSALLSGCLDQSKLVEVRKDGSHFVHDNVRKAPTLKMTTKVNPPGPGLKVNLVHHENGPC